MGISSVGTQPIFRADLSVEGYELLFRGERTATTNGVTMTSSVILSALFDIGLDRLIGDRQAYVNVPREVFLDRLLLTGAVPGLSGRVVLEVPEDSEADGELVSVLAEHRAAGYTLALDDYTGTEQQRRLLPHVQLVKVDLPGLNRTQLADVVATIPRATTTLLAEKVESLDQLGMCREIGFDLYQGYLLSRPVINSQGVLSPSRAGCLRLLTCLADPASSDGELRTQVMADPALSMRVLHAASLGAAGGARRHMKSLTEAIVMLGLRRLSILVILTLLSGDDAGPAEQLMIALSRAKMSELLAQETGLNPETGFTVGLLSAMDLMLGLPIAEIVERTPLDPEIAAAVMSRAGGYGTVLDAVIAQELGQPVELGCLGLTDRQIMRAYLGAAQYARTAFALLSQI